MGGGIQGMLNALQLVSVCLFVFFFCFFFFIEKLFVISIRLFIPFATSY